MTRSINTTQLAIGRILVTLLTLGLVVGTADTGQAQESASTGSPLGFGIIPAQDSDGDSRSLGYFAHNLEPGADLFDEALVVNESTLPVNLQIYVAEAMTAINGGTAFGHRNDDPSGSAGWIELDAQDISLQPGETRLVPFTITVPADAAPGDYVAGLLVEEVRAEAEGGDPSEGLQFSVEVVHRVGVAVVIEVAGGRATQLALTDLRLGNQHEQGAVFELDVHNRGNTMVKGHGTLTVTDLQGKELAVIPFDMDTVLAGDTTFFYIDHPVLLADGEDLHHARVDYQALRSDDTIYTTSLGNIAIEVVNGQPKSANIAETQQPKAPILITGSASPQAEGLAALQADRQQRALVIYAILVTITLVILEALVWPRTRNQPTPRIVPTDATAPSAAAALSGTGPKPQRPARGPGQERPAASTPRRGRRRKSRSREGPRR